MAHFYLASYKSITEFWQRQRTKFLKLFRKIEERSFTSVDGTRKIEIYWNLLKIPEDLNCFLPCAEEFLKDVFISDLQEIPGKENCTEWNYLTYIGKLLKWWVHFFRCGYPHLNKPLLLDFVRHFFDNPDILRNIQLLTYSIPEF